MTLWLVIMADEYNVNSNTVPGVIPPGKSISHPFGPITDVISRTNTEP